MGRVPPELIDELLTLRAAGAVDEVTAALEAELRERIAAERAAGSPLTLADLAVDGRDLREALAIPEGPLIGTILERLLADVVDEPALNTRMTLLTRASLSLEELVQGGWAGSADSPDDEDFGSAAHPPIR